MPNPSTASYTGRWINPAIVHSGVLTKLEIDEDSIKAFNADKINELELYLNQVDKISQIPV